MQSAMSVQSPLSSPSGPLSALTRDGPLSALTRDHITNLCTELDELIEGRGSGPKDHRRLATRCLLLTSPKSRDVRRFLNRQHPKFLGTGPAAAGAASRRD